MYYLIGYRICWFSIIALFLEVLIKYKKSYFIEIVLCKTNFQLSNRFFDCLRLMYKV